MADRADGDADTVSVENNPAPTPGEPGLPWPTKVSLACLGAFVILVTVGCSLWRPSVGLTVGGAAFLTVGLLLGWSRPTAPPDPLEPRIAHIEKLLQRAIGDS